MQISTKYNIGDNVWVINGKTGEVVEREIMGVKTQSLNGVQSTIYSFIKDKFNANSEYHDYLGYYPFSEQDKYFWIPETKCYKSKQELIKKLEYGK